MGDVYMVNGKILSGLPNHAKDIEFDNDGTTLSSTNTEDAIKEVNSNLADIIGIVKTYTITTSNVSDTPYPYYGYLTVSDVDMTQYMITSLVMIGGAGKGVYIASDSGGIAIWTSSAGDFTVRVKFEKRSLYN